MSEQYFHPYQFASEALQLGFEQLVLDGDDKCGPDHVDHEHHSINLTSLSGEWEGLLLAVKVTDPNGQLDNLIPEGETVDAFGVWLTARNGYTRLRKSVQLEYAEGAWRGSLSLDSRDIANTTDIGCHTALIRDVRAVSGFATRQHEVVATSPTWKIYTDTIPSMPGGALNSRWLDFSQSENVELRRRADCVWHLDLTNAESPELLLNEGVPKLRTTLEVESKTGRSARVRDSLIHSILQSAINEMAVYVLANASGEMELDELPDWQRKLLLALARKDETASEELVAARWLNSWQDPAQTSGVLAELSMSVQRHLNLYHSSQYLVQSVETEIQNE